MFQWSFPGVCPFGAYSNADASIHMPKARALDLAPQGPPGPLQDNIQATMTTRRRSRCLLPRVPMRHSGLFLIEIFFLSPLEQPFRPTQCRLPVMCMFCMHDDDYTKVGQANSYHIPLSALRCELDCCSRSSSRTILRMRD